MQSWDWAGFKAAQGQSVTRLGLFDVETLRGGAMVYSVDSPYAPLLLPHGPVLPWRDAAAAAEGAALLSARLAEMSGAAGAPLARFEPLLEGELPAFLGKLTRAPLDLVPTPTLLVDISGSDNDILSRMTQKGRYNVNLAVRKGVLTEAVEPSGGNIKDFYSLFELTSMRQGFDGEPLSFFEALFGALGPSGAARLYLARYRGILAAGAVAVFYGGRATYLYGASSPFVRQAMAPYAMHWQIMRDARARGCGVYDMYGIAPEGAAAHAYSRFTQFKLRFGGRRAATCGAHDLYFYPQLAALLRNALSGKDKGACNV
jgi:lipid II:glycine glycyltransferase (peptidoglycan interpeptide bridge formation enzyme)